jgi:hypothetical protein
MKTIIEGAAMAAVAALIVVFIVATLLALVAQHDELVGKATAHVEVMR